MSEPNEPAIAQASQAPVNISWFRGAVLRVRARTYAAIRASLLLSELVGVFWYVGWLIPVGRRKARLERLLVALRRSRWAFMRRRLTAALAPQLEGKHPPVWRAIEPGLDRYYTDFGRIQKQLLTTSLVLKAPGPGGEKGVLYSSFEYNWVRLAKYHDARAFFSQYLLVGQSSGSPPDFAPAGYLAGLSDDPVFIGVSNQSDMAMLRAAQPVLQPIELMACDWVEPESFRPRPHADRDIDIIMVANWMRFKRHWLLFEALAHMPRGLRVVLVGRNGDRRNQDDILREARAFGARQDFEVYTNIQHQQVRDLLSRSRVSVLFSYREGSCVAPVESMFADTPVAMMHGAQVGSLAYINPATGVLVNRDGLPNQLAEFLERSASFQPRAWAIEHVSCHRSSERLNDMLRRYAESAGQPWTQDIAPLCWRYVPSYVRAEDEQRLAPAVEALERDLGLVLEKFVYRPTS